MCVCVCCYMMPQYCFNQFIWNVHRSKLKVDLITI